MIDEAVCVLEERIHQLEETILNADFDDSGSDWDAHEATIIAHMTAEKRVDYLPWMNE